MSVGDLLNLGVVKGKLELPSSDKRFYIKIDDKIAPQKVETAYHHFKELYDAKQVITLPAWGKQGLKLNGLSYDPRLKVLRLRLIQA